MKSNFPLDKRLLKNIIMSACLLVPAGAIITWVIRDRLPDKFTQGYVAGSVLGLANLYFLIMLVVSLVNPGKVRKLHAAAGFLGINATVFGMFFVIWKHWAGTIGLTAGFTIVLATLLISAFKMAGKS